jgi:hypothetical protein
MAGCLHAVLRGAPPLLGGTGHKLYARECPCVILLLGRSFELGHRHVPGFGRLVPRDSRKISELRDGIALLGDPQAIPRGLFALPGGALAHITAELVSGLIDAGR